MRKLIMIVVLVGLANLGKSQVVVNNTGTVASYVQNVLLGPGISVSNITFNGVPANMVNAQVGEFTDVTSSIGLPAGVIVGSGDVSLAQQSNIGGGSSLGGTGNPGTDPDLSAINAPSAIFDEAILEFDFVPTGDTLSFSYVFASEEYEEYVCANVNDAFGFFLTGPNPLGGSYTALNIALVPDPLVPGTFTTTPVTINTVNPGVAGANGTPATCALLDPNWAAYNVFYQSNTGGTDYEYDGRTVALPIEALVNCGQSYHIKIAIADVIDAVWDSGVFLEAGSFGTEGTVDATQANVPGNVTLCDPPFIVNFDNGVNTPPGNYWDFGDGSGTDTAAAPVYTYADTGTYVVMYVAIDSAACIPTDTAYFTVEILQKDSLAGQITIPPYDPCVDSLTISMAFTGSGADSLYWSMGNGSTFINDTSVTYTYNTPGNYIVTLEAYDLLCNNTFTLMDTVNFTPVVTSVTARDPGNILMCDQPFIVDFVGNNQTPPDSYWDFDDGNTSTQANPSHTYANGGIYNVMYVAIDSSTCNIADTAFFNVQLTIAPPFSGTIDFVPPPPCGLDSFLVDLEFTGVGADSIYWNMGNGDDFSDVNDSVYLFPTSGTFMVTMTAFNFLCEVTEVVETEVTFVDIETTTSMVPNVFTPNGDGHNDELEFIGVDATAEYSIEIFNRWGTKVYSGTNALAHWDGGGHGEGVYFYVLKYTDLCDDTEKLEKGYVSLLK